MPFTEKKNLSDKLMGKLLERFPVAQGMQQAAPVQQQNVSMQQQQAAPMQQQGQSGIIGQGPQAGASRTHCVGGVADNSIGVRLIHVAFWVFD